jgi:ribosomal protein S18 acetylase RimI-like enzyme
MSTTIVESRTLHGTLKKLILGKRTVAAHLSYDCRGDELHIYTVSTMRKFQRMGFASRLLKSVIESHSDKKCIAKVLQGHSNEECMHLFIKFGFQIETYDDEVYMVKYADSKQALHVK